MSLEEDLLLPASALGRKVINIFFVISPPKMFWKSELLKPINALGNVEIRFCWSASSRWIGRYKSPSSTLTLSRLVESTVVPSIHIKRWKSVLRQALINFPFYFVFNRDLVSHAITIDLNSPLIQKKEVQSIPLHPSNLYSRVLIWFSNIGA